jgi:Phage protein (N4 Gp49/phage Sf6 gene 66) family
MCGPRAWTRPGSPLSAAASPENFDAEIGEKIAYADARNRMWALEGYLLRQRLWAEAESVKTFEEKGNHHG